MGVVSARGMPGRREPAQPLRNVTLLSPDVTHSLPGAWPTLDGAGPGVCLAQGREAEVDIAKP